jgi:hypothetical protein
MAAPPGWWFRPNQERPNAQQQRSQMHLVGRSYSSAWCGSLAKVRPIALHDGGFGIDLVDGVEVFDLSARKTSHFT